MPEPFGRWVVREGGAILRFFFYSCGAIPLTVLPIYM